MRYTVYKNIKLLDGRLTPFDPIFCFWDDSATALHRTGMWWHCHSDFNQHLIAISI